MTQWLILREQAQGAWALLAQMDFDESGEADGSIPPAQALRPGTFPACSRSPNLTPTAQNPQESQYETM
jgi:hypothetical protein